MSSGIEGLSELLGKLKKLEGIEKQTDALYKGAMVIEAGAKQRAPVITGFLRSSISSAKVDGGAEVRVAADYAHGVEFGNSSRPANPYLRPTIDEDSDKVVEAVAEQLQKDIAKLAGG